MALLTSALHSKPGLSTTFVRAIEGLNLDIDHVFGTSASISIPGTLRVPPSSPATKLISDKTILAQYYNALEGEIGSDGKAVGGAGQGSINGELQTYSPVFTDLNHVFGSDGLTLTNTMDSPTGANNGYNTYARGNPTTIGSVGLNVNNVTATGAATVTPIANVGLTTQQLALMERGDAVLWGGGSTPTGFVDAIDTVNNTFTVKGSAPLAGSAITNNFVIHFTKLALVPLASEVTNGTTTQITVAFAVPSYVTAGYRIRASSYGADATTYNPMRNASFAKVLSISSDRKTITFDGPINFGFVGSPAANTMILFIPGMVGAQMWSKYSIGSQLPNRKAQAVYVEFTLPSIPVMTPSGGFTKAAIETWLAANPNQPLGLWPAIWLYGFRPGAGGVGQLLDPNNRASSVSELDMMELFFDINRGGQSFTSNRFDMPYSRRRAIASGTTDNALNHGAVWDTTAAGGNQATANAALLRFVASLADGQKHSLAIIHYRDSVVVFIDGLPVCEDTWSTQTDYPYQLGLNVAFGAMHGYQFYSSFFPQDNSQLSKINMKISRILTASTPA